jgi:hypothetical protein
VRTIERTIEMPSQVTASSVERCALAGSVATEVPGVFDQFFDLLWGFLATCVDLGCFSIDGIDVPVVDGVINWISVVNWIISHVALLVVDGVVG